MGRRFKISDGFLVYFAVYVVCFGGDTTAATEFDFGTLTLSTLKLIGDAHLSNGSVRLTRDVGVPYSGAGKVVYSKPILFRRPGTLSKASFSTFFSFSVTNLNPSSIGGGLAFVISSEGDHVGDAGGYIGIMSAKGSGTGVVAVEFDTQMDVEFKDINGNHVGLDLGSMVSSKVGDLDAAAVDLKSGDLVNSWVDYSAATTAMAVYVSYSNTKPREPIISTIIDLDSYLDRDFVYIGFSGSTQGSTEIHTIEWWSFRSFFSDDIGISPPPPPPSPADSSRNQHSTSHSADTGSDNNHRRTGTGAVVGVVTAGALLSALCGVVLLWLYKKKYKHPAKKSLASDVIKTPKEFTYKELLIATKGFDSSRIIGHGAFGTVYRGILPDSGDLVAVKRCGNSGQGRSEFLSELSIIGALRHRNLVRLQGWCHEKRESLLVYDLMTNGSLDKALFESKTPLQWPQRKKVLLGVASALAYLITGRATEKTDVFSYGAVVLEVASGRRPIEKEVTTVGVTANLVDWVWSLHREGRLTAAADPRLQNQYDEADMRRILSIGLACSHPDAAARPPMRTVVQILTGDAEVPVIPRTKPSLSFTTSELLLNLEDTISDLNGMVAISTSSSENSFSGGHGCAGGDYLKGRLMELGRIPNH